MLYSDALRGYSLEEHKFSSLSPRLSCGKFNNMIDVFGSFERNDTKHESDHWKFCGNDRTREHFVFAICMGNATMRHCVAKTREHDDTNRFMAHPSRDQSQLMPWCWHAEQQARVRGRTVEPVLASLFRKW